MVKIAFPSLLSILIVGASVYISTICKRATQGKSDVSVFQVVLKKTVLSAEREWISMFL